MRHLRNLTAPQVQKVCIECQEKEIKKVKRTCFARK
jgi:hypothetical protein